VVSKIFQTGVAIYTAVVVARSTSPNRPNCEFRVLLRRFVATAWKRAKTSPRTLTRTDLAASPRQRHVSHFSPQPAVSGETKKLLSSPIHRTPLIWHPMISSCFQNEIESERTSVWYQWGDPGRIAESAWHYERKGLPGNVPKMEETVRPVSTCGRELLRLLAADRPSCEFYEFYVSPEYFGKTLVNLFLFNLGVTWIGWSRSLPIRFTSETASPTHFMGGWLWSRSMRTWAVNFALTGIRSPDHPSRTESWHRNQ
jgi:hypothetical protein